MKKVSVCSYTVKMVPCDSFKRAIRGRNRKKGNVEEMEEKEKGSFVRLISGLCLEVKIN
jgi:hypothetical protein